MKINIRHSVFETNSSSTHRFVYKVYDKREEMIEEMKMMGEEKHLFQEEEEKTKDSSRVWFHEYMVMEGKLNKYSVIKWLVCDLRWYTNMFFFTNENGEEGTLQYICYRNKIIEGFMKYTYEEDEIEDKTSKEKILPDECFAKISELVNYGGDDEEELLQIIRNEIHDFELEAYKNQAYRYPIYMDGDKVIDNLSDQERIILALKISLFFSHYIFEERCIQVDQFKKSFWNLINKKIDSSFMDLEIYDDLMNCQLMCCEGLYDVVCALPKPEDDEKYEIIPIDDYNSTLCEDYGEYSWVDLLTLGLRFKTYEEFKKAVIDILEDDNIVFFLDYLGPTWF